ncbi:hypothetical protein LWL40_27760 (plasmid) [Bacillus thuringiensis]|uniref:hypothetical protein n=1 Tax=Bacillus thuringiensis TaxID=1428 RepID=UPI003D73F59F
MKSDHKFKVGDFAIINESFGLAEIHDGEVFDDFDDVINYVRGDVVEILRIIHVPQPSKSHPTLAVIYNPKIRDATVVSVEFLDPVKGTIHTGGIITEGKLNPNLRLSY